jgi:hypothetical protein
MLYVHTILPPQHHVIDDPDHICVMCYVGSMTTTRKDESVGYQLGGLYLGKFPTRYNSSLWRQDDEPNVRYSWLKAELGQWRLKLTRYINDTWIWSSCILFNCLFICISIWTLFRILEKKITLLFVVFFLLSCWARLFFPNLFRWHSKPESFLIMVYAKNYYLYMMKYSLVLFPENYVDNFIV